MAKFINIRSPTGELYAVNADTVRYAAQSKEPNQCPLYFDSSHTVTIAISAKEFAKFTVIVK